MPEVSHISSVVLRVSPERMAAIRDAIPSVDGCEVALAQDGKVIVLIEAATSGAVGDRLNALALQDGVYSACLVYEQVETVDALERPHSGDEA